MKRASKNSSEEQPMLLDEFAADSSEQTNESAPPSSGSATPPRPPTSHHVPRADPAGPHNSGTPDRRRPDPAVVEAAVASALWAAWGDALGFISELTDLRGLGRRLNRDTGEWGDDEDAVARMLSMSPAEWPLHGTPGWRRRVGGRGGAFVDLPPGTYSDDTQLRLATSRSILNGRFSPEMFAYIELPVFVSYGLGGGRATKSGALAMTRSNRSWSVPGHSGWVDAGGNGVVMRVAPLAYAAVAHSTGLDDLLLATLRNAVATHGHPRALLPACLHVLALQETLQHRQLAPMRFLHHWLDALRHVPLLMESDTALRHSIAFWERKSRRSYAAEWDTTIGEMHQLVDMFASTNAAQGLPTAYLDIARSAGLFAPATRGSGTATFVAAYWLADAFQNDPILGLIVAANSVGTDTDTIATVAGAHLGVVHPFLDPGPLMDRDYIAAETLRVMSPHHRDAAAHPGYPDPEDWRAPRAQADFLGLDPRSGRVAVAGLGPGEYISQPFPSEGPGEFAWQWVAEDYGQTLLVKRRYELSVLPFSALPTVETLGTPGQPTVEASAELEDLRSRAQRASAASRKGRGERPSARPVEPVSSVAPDTSDAPELAHAVGLHDSSAALTLEAALTRAENAQFNPEVVGVLLRALSRDVSADAAAWLLGYATAIWRRGGA